MEGPSASTGPPACLHSGMRVLFASTQGAGPVSTPRRAATIGVYDWTLEEWLGALRGARASQVFDIRQSRGVRGSRYAWANSTRLQGTLAEAGIEYRHCKELAPTTELRELQYREDDRRRVGKRSRVRARRRVPGAVLSGDSRPGRASADRRGDAGRWGNGAHVRRGRPRGLPPLARRGAPAGGVRAPGGAPAASVRLGQDALVRRVVENVRSHGRRDEVTEDLDLCLVSFAYL